MSKKIFFGLAALTIIASSCQNEAASPATSDEETVQTEEKATEPEHTTTVVMEKDGISLSTFTGSPEYPDASLRLNGYGVSGNGEEESARFEFKVANYELAVQTPGAESMGIANSGKGQHIHLIVDNGPYSAHYMPDVQMTFSAGHHVALAFLSRSYHESIKNGKAFKVFQFNVGETEEEDTDLSQPMLFYSRPKGEYKGDATEKVLFDFYLHNVELSEDGYQVRMTVNGTTEFMISEWRPFLVEGMPIGENTIKIELLDAEGNVVNEELNTVNRTFTLAE